MSSYPPRESDVRQANYASSQTAPPFVAGDRRSSSSAVSWGAIFAGAATAATLSLILLILGTGLGLSAVSPWAPKTISAQTFGVSAIIWITVTQLLASGMGGYLAGRLRTKWVSVPNDEIYFRDTTHGFLAWAIATLATAAVLSSVTGSIVSMGVQAGATVAGTATSVGAATMAATSGASPSSEGSDSPSNASAIGGYFMDSLFRKDMSAPATPSNPASPTPPALPGDNTPMTAASLSETTRIFANAIRAGALPPEDASYVAQLVSQRTGIAQADAEKRVNETFARMQTKLRDAETAARVVADKARKATSYAALWVFVSLLIGAFVASLAATFGGRQRDIQTHSQTLT